MADMTTEEINKVDALAAEAAANTPQTATKQVNTINQMYDAQKQAQLAGLQSAYELNRSNMQAAADKIPQTYQQKANDLNAQYEKNKRNFNQQAAVNGLNTGTASQAELAQNNVYLRDYGAMRTAEANAATEAQRGLVDLETKYRGDVAAAIANNDYSRAAALMDEYNNQYKRDADQANILAEYGDFSGYANLYGQDAATNMFFMWAAQNPDLAYNMGRITKDQKDNLKAGRPINDGLDATGNRVGGSSGGGNSGGYDWTYNDGWAAAKATAQGYIDAGSAGAAAAQAAYNAGNLSSNVYSYIMSKQ